MRLWHYKLIPFLSRQRLLGQHRECCALRGKGWGRKHSTVDYVFTHSYYTLVCYHFLVIEEMSRRNYNVEPLWTNDMYRGKILGIVEEYPNPELNDEKLFFYPEHNESYLKECLSILEEKGEHIE